VHAFLSENISFLGIAEVIERTLERMAPERVRAFESLYEADRQAREHAAGYVQAAAGRLSH